MNEKRTAISVQDKLKIILMVETNPDENQMILSQCIGIPFSILNTILSKEE